ERGHEGGLGGRGSGCGRDVGRLRLRYDTERRRIVWHEWTRLPVDSRVIPADPDVNREVQAWEAKVAGVVHMPIARSAKLVDRDASRMLMQQVLIDRFKADAAFIEPGSVRDVIPEGGLLA